MNNRDRLVANCRISGTVHDQLPPIIDEPGGRR